MEAVKLNVDATFTEGDLQLGTSIVVHNHEEEMIRVQALWCPYAASSMIMEAYAIRDTAQLASVRGYRRIIIENDARAVVQVWEEDRRSLPSSRRSRSLVY